MSIYTQINLATVGAPAGVFIGRKGCTINEMKNRSGAHICIKGDQICINGSHKSTLTVKELIQEIVHNFQNGINGFQQIQKKQKNRRKVVVTDGWNHITRNGFPELNQKKEEKVEEVSSTWSQIVKKGPVEKGPVEKGPVEKGPVEKVGQSIAEIDVDLEKAEMELKLLREKIGTSWADIADNEEILEEAIDKVRQFKRGKTSLVSVGL
tara:strand:- start:3605 stop:4231 length:627 start_codon:yes stop_codon:yes gene_type:complete